MFPRFIALTAILVGLASASHGHDARDYQRVEPLLDTKTTVLDQPLAYPQHGDAKIQSAIVTLLPGEETGTHSHPYPTYGYILSGELTVAYPGGIEKVYRQGEAVMDAVNEPHNGRNDGSVPVRVLVVFMGVDGEANTHFPDKD
ncbi:cupin domain-containing protein [Hoeflea poritis]|uniref:Cupin domain-containing protein n=1 Tax=Hoeflea poritis TaxID=2993659 RepID=A0ABT4VLC2_9HYPH|nr:cupin domain-containing protein [Hoeflea poritis]MDA4845517.1 cupin domain-containing protein [Hoeflea poritis]